MNECILDGLLIDRGGSDLSPLKTLDILLQIIQRVMASNDFLRDVLDMNVLKVHRYIFSQYSRRASVHVTINIRSIEHLSMAALW